MKYINFAIKNYKGIKSLNLDVNILPDCKIYTLVGLNESGKTTILEAINDYEREVPLEDRHRLIPKSSAGGFTGDISIEAQLSFNDKDKIAIGKFLKERGFKEVSIQKNVTICRTYSFDNSVPKESKRTYTPFVKVKKTARSKETNLQKEIFNELFQYMSDNLFPDIIFYRDFLSKFPERIWLEPENEKERDYFSIIEDVLVSINPCYNVADSILERRKNPTDANIQALEAIENDLGAKISEKVFDAWNKILKVSKKEIIVKTASDGQRHYIKLSVKEGRQSYAVSERSLGFKWFFTFLLYTEFRKERIKTSGEILFLLDEPASNLHQTAQKSLLDTFEKLTSGSRLIYTTHSHHLINPIWLNSSYIVKNNGLKYYEGDDFNVSKTEVEAYKYKQFVSNYPTETSYFQPILDVLDHQPGLLEMVPNIVITEGKFDYFVLKYFKEIVFSDLNKSFNFYPGHGAGKLDLPIALYESWGKQYIAILDSDKEGIAQKKRYIKEISNADSIYTLQDILDLKSSTTEDIFSKEELLLIGREFNKDLKSYNKSSFNTGIQTLYIEKRVPDYISSATKESFKKILGFVQDKFGL